jgi:hypothetical protein
MSRRAEPRILPSMWNMGDKKLLMVTTLVRMDGPFRHHNFLASA